MNTTTVEVCVRCNYSVHRDLSLRCIDCGEPMLLPAEVNLDRLEGVNIRVLILDDYTKYCTFSTALLDEGIMFTLPYEEFHDDYQRDAAWDALGDLLGIDVKQCAVDRGDSYEAPSPYLRGINPCGGGYNASYVVIPYGKADRVQRAIERTVQ